MSRQIRPSEPPGYPGKVLETWESLHMCGYDGYSPDNDEWFGPDRIRKAR